jgi:hypothetical protein
MQIVVVVAAALLAVPVASAIIRPPVQSDAAAQALLVRGQGLDRIYLHGTSVNQAIRALELRGEALNRFYHLGAYANTTKKSSISQSKTFGTTAGGAPLAPGNQDVSSS